MRENMGLYRGKRKDNGEWVYGDLIHGRGEQKGRLFIWYETDKFPYAEEAEVIPETLGQYTGLTDKNGKRIFEGDILGAKHPKQMKAVPCLVKYGEYKDEDGLSDCRYLGFCLQALGKCCSILTPLSDGIEYEVIGNFHDTPELLEES